MKKNITYDLRASEERMLNDWRNKKITPIKPIFKKKPKNVKKTTINHAKGLSYSEFLASGYWKKVRKKVFIRDNYKCVVCRTDKNLRVHHLSYKHHGFEHKYLNDLMTLCNDCHEITHGIVTDRIPLNF